jgi:hypothetical protein
MSDSMKDLNDLMGACMAGAAIYTASVMMLKLLFELIAKVREQLRQVLGHEPTREDWDDYWQFQNELASGQTSRQRVEDREKIRRLVMGETDAA